jgi:hypothetical protein
MSRIRKDFKRRSGYRDARLFVIATEGEKTEIKYFKDLNSKEYLDNPKVHIEVLPRVSSSSSPNHVIKVLDGFRSEYKLRLDDELWMVVDHDRWPQQLLGSVFTECVQKGYRFAVSNPCFETWLLLHLKDIEEEYSREEMKRFSCNDLKVKIREILGSYNPSNLDTSKFLPFLHSALNRARKLDIDHQTRWPACFGTRLYKLVDSISRD